MHKKELRKLYRDKREKLSQVQAMTQSREMIDLLLESFSFHPFLNLHTFLPILKRKEVNTFYLVEKLYQNYPELTILTSTTDFQTHEMHTFKLAKDTVLEENQFGIPEPVQAEPFPHRNIQVIIIPLLCIDQKGNRVGYGQGHYDRFLSHCADDLIKIGLSYFPPVPQVEGLEQTDVPLNFAIAGDQFIQFQSIL